MFELSDGNVFIKNKTGEKNRDVTIPDIKLKAFIESEGKSIEVPIPYELEELLSDMLNSYYRRLLNERF